MDTFLLDNVSFPIESGTLCELRDGFGDYRWCVELWCAKAIDLDGEHWLSYAEPYLYAQLLPLRVTSPEQLVGRIYSFDQSPHDDPPTWDCDQWPFFCLYIWEHNYVYPVQINFIENAGSRYRVKINGNYPCGNSLYNLSVETWLDWEFHQAE